MNSRRTAPLSRSILLPGFLLLSACTLLAGCAWLTPAEPVPAFDFPPLEVPADPNAFPWESQVLEASGTSSASQAPGAIPQRSFAAKQSAKTAALYRLREQIEQLPVHEEVAVGAVTDTFISVRHGIDQALQRADVVEERPLPDGRYEVRVRTPLAPIAEVLRQSYVTPNDPLPVNPDSEETMVSPLI